jgi:hypothetical protein
MFQFLKIHEKIMQNKKRKIQTNAQHHRNLQHHGKILKYF